MLPSLPSLSIRGSLFSLRLLRPIPEAGHLRAYLPAFSSRLGWILYTLACCCFFIVLTFPTDLLIQRTLAISTRGLPMRIRYLQGEFTWRGACVLRDVVIEGLTPNLPTLKVARLSVQPSLLGLLVGRFFPLAFSADLYDGTVSGTVVSASGRMNTQLAVRHLALGLLPLPPSWGRGGITGSLTGDGDFKGDFSDLLTLRGTLTLNLAGGSLRSGSIAGFPAPSLQAVQSGLHATLNAGRIEITDFSLSADGVEAHLQGAVVLGTPLARSGLDLQLTAKTMGTPPPSLTILLSLLPASPGVPGERRASISGALATPVVR